MNFPASPAATSRPQTRFSLSSLIMLFACTVSALASVSCSSTSAVGPGYVSTNRSLQSSSTRSDASSSATEWDPESLPISGATPEIFPDIGPDYFANLLRNASKVGAQP